MFNLLKVVFTCQLLLSGVAYSQEFELKKALGIVDEKIQSFEDNIIDLEMLYKALGLMREDIYCLLEDEQRFIDSKQNSLILAGTYLLGKKKFKDFTKLYIMGKKLKDNGADQWEIDSLISTYIDVDFNEISKEDSDFINKNSVQPVVSLAYLAVNFLWSRGVKKFSTERLSKSIEKYTESLGRKIVRRRTQLSQIKLEYKECIDGNFCN